MNTRKSRGTIFVLGLAIALVASACGTLQIDTEPTALLDAAETPVSAENPAVTLAEDAQPTTTLEELDRVMEEATDSGAAAVGDVATVVVGAVEAPVSTPSEVQSYTNREYGFSLSYPPNWSLAEVNDADFVGPGSRSVQLSQGTVKLVIGYRLPGDMADIWGRTGLPAGELELRGTAKILDHDVARYVLVYEGKDKSVMYGQPGSPPLALGGLELSPRMDDFNPDYDSVALSQTIQDEADMILSSLAIIEAEGAAGATTTGADYSGWQSYTNESLGYSLMYPGQADLMGADRNKAVEFVGPIIGDDHWPWFTVQHFDSEFFRPPAGTDVRQWLADSNIPYDPVDEEMTIGGLPAVHYAVDASPQAYGSDEYYVIHDDQLFKITLLHAGGNEDWALYEQFLASIAFTAGK